MVTCKKKKEVSVDSVDSPFTLSTAQQYSGAFYTNVMTITDQNVSRNVYSAYALFSSMPTDFYGGQNFINVKGVELNGELLENKNFRYTANNYTNVAKRAWIIDGDNGIPSFHYTETGNIPVFQSIDALPDSISLSKGLNIKINGLESMTEGSFVISDSSNPSADQIIISLFPGDNNVVITPADFAGFTPTRYASISISCRNKTVLNFSEKDYLFDNLRSLIKGTKLVP